MAEKYLLDNGIPVYDVRMGTQEVLKLELVFLAGRPFERQKLAARATAALLKEGTIGHNGAEIAEVFDFYGGTLSAPVNLDTSTLVLYCLKRHFEYLLPLLAEIIRQPAFPEEELEALIERNKGRLQVDLSRNDVVAYRAITECIFGKDHPYGYNSYPQTYDELRREHVLEHFNRLYHTANCRIFISGRTDEQTISLLNTYLGQGLPEGRRETVSMSPSTEAPRKVFIEHPDTVQSAIRIGRQTFDRRHSDYQGLYVLNTVLGGYFGSRLMANIREEKGFTYNIYSTLDAMRYDGYFYIGTEVGREFTEAAIQEIYRELDLLRVDLIDKEEMAMVRNYLLGNLLTMLDGPFNVSEVVRTLIMDELPLSDFADLAEIIRTISPEKLRELARQYLDPADMWEVVVG